MSKTDASSEFVMGYAKETLELFAEDGEDVGDPTSLQPMHSNVFVKVYRGLREELRVAVDFKKNASGRCGAWYYGYVEIHEFVQVENEELVEESLACFPLTKREALPLTVPGSVPPCRRMIRRDLRNGGRIFIVNRLRSQMEGAQNARFTMRIIGEGDGSVGEKDLYSRGSMGVCIRAHARVEETRTGK
ncbi:hypothetical protein SELMODRAFT_431338 [Selaginella moellendorffii]|uniref:Uncharacterized protein n=1 Tax=Selaginella moellendorffii TaxID=88036 RepID=D8TCA0_SELML|nr:hypothetical protein SELMODRAFT_431338 [Selaginella moellendorffii]